MSLRSTRSALAGATTLLRAFGFVSGEERQAGQREDVVLGMAEATGTGSSTASGSLRRTSTLGSESMWRASAMPKDADLSIRLLPGTQHGLAESLRNSQLK